MQVVGGVPTDSRPVRIPIALLVQSLDRFGEGSLSHSLFVRLISYKPSMYNCAKLTDAEYRFSERELQGCIREALLRVASPGNFSAICGTREYLLSTASNRKRRGNRYISG